MCPPLVIAAVALGAAQAGMSIHGQRQQAKTQEKMQKNASAAEQQRHLQEMSAARLRERQEMTSAAQAIQESTKKAREARATGRVSAGEAGVSGLSVDALLNDMTRKEAEYSFSVQQQQQFQSINRDLAFQDGAMQSRMNLLSINKPIAQPNYLGAILDGAQTGMSAYSFGSKAGFGQGGGTPAAASSGASAFDSSSAFNVSQSSYTPFTAPTTFK
jgi:hypothetical protein